MNKYDCTKSNGCPVPGHKCHTRRQLCFPGDRSQCTDDKLEVIRLGGTYNMFCGVAKGLPGTIDFAQDNKCEEWEISSSGLCYLPACDEKQIKCLRDEKECQALELNSADLKCFWKTVPGGSGKGNTSGPVVSESLPSSGLNGGQIAGIGIGSAVGVAIIAVGLLLFFRKKQSNRNASTPPSYVENGEMTPIEVKTVTR
ncbi:hypothetical protein K7432_017718 [Basidiobolus ranarum]|uniref:Uncharacterized protein n=1 Tax=Basidiobolus ranarum TaxID=34480 RepID=A0ABR2VJZ2_9FUNG